MIEPKRMVPRINWTNIIVVISFALLVYAFIWVFLRGMDTLYNYEKIYIENNKKKEA